MHCHRRGTIGWAFIALLACLSAPDPARANVGGMASGDFNGDGFADLVISAHNEDLVGAVNCGGVQVIYGRGSGLSSVGDDYWHQNKAGINDSAEEFDEFGQAIAVGDFDGDGFDDLAIGVADEDVGGVESAGAVAVLYGSPAGLRASGDQFLHQDSTGILDSAEEFDFFGVALAAGDFDGDGFDDLAIGASGEDLGKVTEAGAVNVIYGSSNGLRGAGDQFWHQDVEEVEDSAEVTDFYGFALAAGDFNDDGFADLAIGIDEDLELPASLVGDTTIFDAGAVNVIYGSSDGLSAADDQFWTQDSEGIDGFASDGDQWGERLASGDFDGDGNDDLVVGAPFDEEVILVLVGAFNHGTVTILYGSNDGLTATGSQLWHEGIDGIPEDPGSFDLFGWALAVGDFNGDGNDDLAIGVPEKDFAKMGAPGLVHVLYGTADGLATDGNQAWTQDVDDVANSAESGDRFGSLLGAGDFDGDGEDDLGIGVPGEDVNIDDSGAVNVLYGSNNGLNDNGNQFWHQDKPTINNNNGSNDYFGGDEAID